MLHDNLMQIARFLLFFSLLIATSAIAQGYRGTDFWVCFPKNALDNHEGAALEQRLYIAADSRTTGLIQAEDDTAGIPFSVESGTSIAIAIDSNYELHTSGQIERKSFHITSERPVSLMVVSHRHASADTYEAIPTTMLGKEYIVAGFTANANPNASKELTTQAQIIATEDNTLVTVYLTGSTSDEKPKGRTLAIPMNKGDVFQMNGAGEQSDLTGTRVTSTKPIGFLTGHRCAQVPSNISFCDMLVEMEPPTNEWGTDFIATKFQSKDVYVLRIIARDDSTEVTVNGIRHATLGAGKYLEIDTTRYDCVLHTSKPVLVAQYSTSAQADAIASSGDPFMLLLVPNDRFVSTVMTSSIGVAQWKDYLNIVVPDSGLLQLRLDGVLIDATPRKMPGGLLVLTKEVISGSHTVACSAPIAVYSYGFGYLTQTYDSYGHTCGMRLDEQNQPAKSTPAK